MVAKECSVEGCEKGGVMVRGMCQMHYTRVLRYGSTEGRTKTISGRPRCKSEMSLADRIAHIGFTVTPNGCHEWNGHLHSAGYPIINFHRKPTYIHRAALEQKLGRTLGPGMFACHRCDNPPCINPDHLFEADAAGNHADMMQKGRHRAGKGGRKPTVYPHHVFDTLLAMKASGASPTEISVVTGLSLSYTYSLLNGHNPLPKEYLMKRSDA